MDVVAVVLNWRRPGDTIRCVSSLAEVAPAVRPIVVDNDSGDDSLERFARDLPGVAVLANPINAGYAGGNNVGIRAALELDPDAVLVLNNDIVLRPDCVALLEEGLRARSDWGIVAPLSLRADDPSLVDFYSATVDVRNMALLAWGRDEQRDYTEPVESDYATGSAFLARAPVLRKVGLFDERFFLVWEDVDFGIRARKAGWGIGVVPRARVVHERSASFGGDGAPLHKYFFVRNSFLILAKHGNPLWRWRTRRMMERRYAGWAAMDDSPAAVAVARGLADGRDGRFGPPPVHLFGGSDSAGS